MAKKPIKTETDKAADRLQAVMDAEAARMDYRNILGDRELSARVRWLEGMWTSEQRNSVICGHLLNAWAIVIGLIIVFANIGDRRYGAVAVYASLATLACSWYFPNAAHRDAFRLVAIASQATAYIALILWSKQIVAP